MGMVGGSDVRFLLLDDYILSALTPAHHLTILCICRYGMFIAPMLFMFLIGVPAKPQTGIKPWAKKRAELELRQEGI